MDMEIDIDMDMYVTVNKDTLYSVYHSLFRISICVHQFNIIYLDAL